ncbi:hypothetical protein RRG08_007432 [Elysia crispata]|uniref:Endonuclease/exonuclease/phosphatase domain-containing protein n=1 Tax=Elysia crispata TaxID=231223 RepID=A0AAE1ABC4_9GAST|nr:hypothetical protein RRG08_007432 [Elysia crispata]
MDKRPNITANDVKEGSCKRRTLVRLCPDEQKTRRRVDKFYDDLEKAKSQCKSQEVKIIQGDFNAKVGKGRRDDIIGEYGLGERNERGDRLFEGAKMNEMIIGNTWFEHHPRRLWTWLSNDDETRNQIDYILIDKRFRNGMINIKHCQELTVTVITTY